MGLWADIRVCTKCELHKYMDCQPIPGFTKNPKPDIMLIGEVPGIEECLIEKPLQGLGGKLLDKMLSEAKIDRNNLYCTQIVKCRPTIDNLGKKNRPAKYSEIQQCLPWLYKEIRLIKPKLIITLGLLPLSRLMQGIVKNPKMEDVCGKTYNCLIDDEEFVPLVPIYHPSSLVQGSANKLKQCQDILNRLKVTYELCKW